MKQGHLYLAVSFSFCFESSSCSWSVRYSYFLLNSQGPLDSSSSPVPPGERTSMLEGYPCKLLAFLSIHPTVHLYHLQVDGYLQYQYCASQPVTVAVLNQHGYEDAITHKQLRAGLTRFHRIWFSDGLCNGNVANIPMHTWRRHLPLQPRCRSYWKLPTWYSSTAHPLLPYRDKERTRIRCARAKAVPPNRLAIDERWL